MGKGRRGWSRRRLDQRSKAEDWVRLREEFRGRVRAELTEEQASLAVRRGTELLEDARKVQNVGKAVLGSVSSAIRALGGTEAFLAGTPHPPCEMCGCRGGVGVPELLSALRAGAQVWSLGVQAENEVAGPPKFPEALPVRVWEVEPAGGDGNP